MRSYDKYRETKYLQKSDLEKPVLLTIAKIAEEDVSSNDRPEKIKYVIYFKEAYNPWVPNIGSLEEISHIAGTGDVDRWPGTVIVLYVNPDVEFAGKRVGGIRCRAPKNRNQGTQESGSNPDWVGEDPPPPPNDGIPY